MPTETIDGLKPALPVLARAFAEGLRPPPVRSVAQWAEQAPRIVSAESGTRWPGPWSNAIAPYLVEIMECLSLSHPAREVTFKKSAQVAGSEAGINLIANVIAENPAPVLVVLPTLDEGKKYVKLKLQPTIEATPVLRQAVREQKSRDEDGSTTFFKKFKGGFVQVTGANTSKGLQMITARVIVKEEISEWPYDVDGRGDPFDLADRACKIFEGREKKTNISTPGVVDESGRGCRVSERYAASDQRRYYVPCPHCDGYQVLEFDRLAKEDPDRAVYSCRACGADIEHHAKRAMLAKGVWLKTYAGPTCPPQIVRAHEIEVHRARPSGNRQPGFAINVLYSPVETWQAVAQRWIAAQGNPRKLKVFYQQDLGEPWEERGEQPDHDRLHEAATSLEYGWQRIPPGALFVTAAIDVQGNRLEFGVYAWGVGLTGWLIDKGIVEGDPSSPETWAGLDKVLARTYEDRHGKPWRIDLAGIDTGYQTQAVYRYVRRHAAAGKVYALDGRDGWKLPPLGTPKKQDVDFEGKRIGAIMLWPVGTWDLKSEHYWALGEMLKGPDPATGRLPQGAIHYNDRCDPAYFKQLTAEFLKEVEVGGTGRTRKVWHKDRSTPNEALDIAVYARGLAHHLSDQLTAADWANLAATRGAPPIEVQADLARLWSPPLPGATEGPSAAPSPPAEERESHRADPPAIDDRLGRHWN
ncbi:MAG: phage terminase large subunit family protein [Reyranellaceae bacterium]